MEKLDEERDVGNGTRSLTPSAVMVDGKPSTNLSTNVLQSPQVILPNNTTSNTNITHLSSMSVQRKRLENGPRPEPDRSVNNRRKRRRLASWPSDTPSSATKRSYATELVDGAAVEDSQDSVQPICHRNTVSSAQNVQLSTKTPQNKVTAQEQEMDLPWLEKNLGVTYSSCKRGQVVLPSDKFQWLNEQTEDDGTTLLMKAAEEGDAECVELLLMCGVDVNGSRSIEYQKRRPIDFAIEKDHRKVGEILLEWDSILPDSDSESLIKKLKSMSEENEDIKKFFEERDRFHELIRTGDICEIERILKSREDDVNNSRCKHWVNSHGESSLCTAVYAGKHDAWAFLLSRKFESLGTETEQIEFLQKNKVQRKKFDRAMGKYFLEVEDGHVFKLLSKTKVRGGSVEKRLDIKKIYLDANQIPEAKLLMQCLQFDSDFEIVFELDRPDIKNTYAMANSDVLGVMDTRLRRVYASAGLESHPQVVSNLIHEFCHRVMYNVFMNNGLPYKMSDEKMQNAYKEIFNKIMSNIHNCDPIIKRLNYYKNNFEQELIVRIPEIITEGKIGGKEEIEWNTDIEKELSKFYHDHVEKEIKDYIKNHTARQRISPLDILLHPSIISGYQKDYAIVGEIGQPEMCLHHGIKYISVSDLSLGISHMEKSLGDVVTVEGWSVLPVVTVDLSFFMKSKTYFVAQLERGYFQNLIVVWDKGTEFCSNPDSCSCLANMFQTHEEYVTLLVPKEITSCHKEECVDYHWKNLSKGTKEWILKQHVIFQGRNVVLQELLEGLLSNMEIESTISTIIDPNDISLMIQQKKYVVGNDVESDLEKKICEMLYGQPETFFPRRTKVRPLAFDEELMEQRKTDAVFFFHTTEDDLKEAKVSKVRQWKGAKTQAKDVRHFFLNENIDAAGRRKYIHKICKEMRKVPNSDGSWSYAHFFLKNKKKKNFTHIYSERINDQRCLLLADEPGSGKSVFLHSKARNEKEKKNKDKWVEVVKLTECEDDFQKWMGTKQNLGVEDFLYQLTNRRRDNGDDLTLEKELFSLFCHSEERVGIYFDGFDEICPAFKEKVSCFLEKLLENTSVNFFVTTRTNQREDLEKRLTTIAHTLDPFNRREQVKFIDRQWNGMLKLLPEESRAGKIRAIAAKWKARGYNGEEIISMKNVGEGSNQDAEFRDYIFKKAAEFLMRKCKSHPKDKGYFSETPLHAYMMASESFENDLSTHNALNIFRLFKKFVDFKIKLYLKEKAKVPELQTSITVRNTYEASMLKNLKKFSVNLFLEESTYKPTDQEKENMLSTGILVMRDGSIEFIHRTFAEYLFSCRLFDEDANLRDVLFEKVLLNREFETVRDFIDAMILSEISEGNAVRNERAAGIARFRFLLSEGNTYGIRLCRRVFLQAIPENHAGILQFLGAMPREYLSTVMFLDSNDDSNTFKEEKGANDRSAFSLLRECNDAKKHKERPKYMIIHTLLQLVETNNLIAELGNYILEEGLEFTGLDRGSDKTLKKYRLWILKFFFKHKELLKEPLKNDLLEDQQLTHSSLMCDSTFRACRSLIDAIFVEEDFQLTFSPTESDWWSVMFEKWYVVLSNTNVTEVHRLWRYLESKLTTEKERETFLRRRDKDGWNSLFSANTNEEYSNNATYVKNIMARILKGEELKDYIFESFTNLNPPLKFTSGAMMDWLETALEDKYLGIDDVLRILQSKDIHGKMYMLDLSLSSDPYYWYNLQKILYDRERHWYYQIKEIIRNILFFEKRFYLFPPTFITDHYMPMKMLKREADEICTILKRFGLFYDVPLNNYFFILGWTYDHRCQYGPSLLKYYSLIWRQMNLELQYFLKDEVMTRIKYSPDTTYVLPKVRLFKMPYSRTTIVAPLLIPFLFSTLLHFFPLRDVAEALICIFEFISNIIDEQMPSGMDPLLFVEFYNVVNRTELRNCMYMPSFIGKSLDHLADSVGWNHGETLLDVFNRKYQEIRKWAESNSPQLINHDGRLKSIYDILEMDAVEEYGHLPYHSLQSYLSNGNNPEMFEDPEEMEL